MRRGRDAAGKHRARGHRLGNAGLWPDDGAVADLDVIDHADLPGQSDVFAEPSAAGDSRLGCDHGMLTDDHIVGDLYQVVDLGSSLNDGFAQRRSIDRGIGADLHVIFDDDDADLRDLDPPGTGAGITETVAADDYTGVQDDSIADSAALPNDDVGVEQAVGADLRIRADKDAGKEHRSTADFSPGADKYVGKYRHAIGKLGTAVDMGRRAALTAEPGTGKKKRQNFCKGDVRVGGFDKTKRPKVGPADDAGTDDHGAGFTPRKKFLIARIGEKGDLSGAGLVDRRNSVDNDAAVSNDFPLDMISQFTE